VRISRLQTPVQELLMWSKSALTQPLLDRIHKKHVKEAVRIFKARALEIANTQAMEYFLSG
jgi:hypothetical protein